MKKSLITLFSALLVSSALSFNGNAVNAADKTGDNDKKSTASILIQPGNLQINDATQDITFNPITWNGKEQKPAESSDAKITIGDYRGSVNKGWSLRVKKSQDNDGFNNGIQLAFNAETSASNISTASKGTSLGYSDLQVAYVSGQQITATALESLIDLNPALTVPGSVRIDNNDLDKVYKTTLVWTLGSTPENV